ncbi:MAG: uroporphyrinogen-III synthase [Thiotrichaceae bacterium]|nr:uroporphyrinogen-III synthase [Thiotrichaceae bacterium]
MTKQALQVLVTRPTHQADSLCYQLEEMGVVVHRFPTIEIQGCSPELPLSLDKNTIIIFTSVNAVNYGLEYFTHRNISLSQHKILAIGAKTTQQLIKHDLYISVQAKAPYNSESLLKLPILNEDIQQQSILIIKGQGGRGFLKRELLNRKASVQGLSVYQRTLPKIEKAVLATLYKAPIDIIMLTSVESTQNLMTLLAEQPPAWLTQAQLLLGSPRIADKIKSLALPNPYWTASNPADKAMLACLNRASTMKHNTLK